MKGTQNGVRPMAMSLNAVALFGLIGLITPTAQAIPPTVDPTYGKPLPKPLPKVKQLPDAEWIWTQQVSDNQTIYARRNFRLGSQPKSATLYVTADNEFTAYVNGTKVSASPDDPTDIYLWRRVQKVDVAAYLKPGANTIAVQAHNDDGAAGLLVRLEVDSKPVILSDHSWKVSLATPAESGTEPSYSDKAWVAANVEAQAGDGPWGDSLNGWPTALSVIPSYLFHLPIAPVGWAYPGDPDHLDWHNAADTTTFDRPANDTDGSPWRVIFDFGKELTGRVLEKTTATGTSIGTGESTGEVLNQPFTTSTTDASPYTALRYASITIPGDQDHVDLHVMMDHLYYPVQYLGNFDCSDPLLTKIWYTGAYTAHLCMQQDIWDAPKRDRVRWMGDLHVSGEVINNVFADKFLMEHTMLLLRQDAQGGRPPQDLPTAYVNGIPGYSAAWFAGLADFYRHIGDKKFLASQHEAIITMLEFCKQDFDKENLFANKKHTWVYTDWSPEFTGDTPVSRVATDLFMIKGAKEAVYMLRALGDKANAAKYSKWVAELTEAAQTHLATDDGTFGDRRQENAMAIYSGVATKAETEDIFNAGIFKPETGLPNEYVSPYYGNYVLRAMALGGHTEQGLDYVRTFWGQMIKDGATTFYETYDPSWEKDNFHAHLQWDDHNNASAGYHVSLCHGWSAGPVNFLTECVLGVQSTGAGFQTCTIAPHLGDLTWVSGAVPTPHGKIEVKVQRTATGMMVTMTIPSGVKATVTLPSSMTAVDGKPVSTASVTLGPGSHTVSGS